MRVCGPGLDLVQDGGKGGSEPSLGLLFQGERN